MWRGFIVFFLALQCGLADSGREMPFDFLHNQIVVQGMLNRHGPYTFILDTGTRATTIDIRVTKELNLAVGAHTRVEGVGAGHATIRSMTYADLQLGGITVPHLEAAVLDLSLISRSLGRPLHGVLGFGFLESRITQIDYFQRRIRFLMESPPQANSEDAAKKSITFPMQFGLRSVLPVLEDCYVNGTRLAVTLDTGSSMGLVLFPRAIERLGLGELAGTGIPIEAGGYLGEARLTKGWVRSMILKNIDLGAVEVAYVRKGYAIDEDPDRRGGSVGNAILQDFVLTLDYPARRVTLESTAE